jgi:thioredoxin reductase
MYDLLVVGGGPAGLTATIYALRKRLNVLMISKDLGGKANWRLALPGVEEYHQIIKGLEVVDKFKTELEYLNFARNMESVKKVSKQGAGFIVETEDGEKLETKAVIIATGTKQVLLDIPGEKEYMMRGLGYSALSYAQLFIDKTTTVIGDGPLALRSAADLATVGTQVNLVGPAGGVLETSLGQKLKAADNVTVYEGYKAVEVLGGEYAEKIVAESPAGEKVEIAADAAFVEMGLTPNSQMVADLVDLDENGRIKIDCGANTSASGIFAAGDVTTLDHEQVLIAVGEGAKAALSAFEYILKL